MAARASEAAEQDHNTKNGGSRRTSRDKESSRAPALASEVRDIAWTACRPRAPWRGESKGQLAAAPGTRGPVRPAGGGRARSSSGNRCGDGPPEQERVGAGNSVGGGGAGRRQFAVLLSRGRWDSGPRREIGTLTPRSGLGLPAAGGAAGLGAERPVGRERPASARSAARGLGWGRAAPLCSQRVGCVVCPGACGLAVVTGWRVGLAVLRRETGAARPAPRGEWRRELQQTAGLPGRSD